MKEISEKFTYEHIGSTNGVSYVFYFLYLHYNDNYPSAFRRKYVEEKKKQKQQFLNHIKLYCAIRFVDFTWEISKIWENFFLRGQHHTICCCFSCCKFFFSFFTLLYFISCVHIHTPDWLPYYTHTHTNRTLNCLTQLTNV